MKAPWLLGEDFSHTCPLDFSTDHSFSSLQFGLPPWREVSIPWRDVRPPAPIFRFGKTIGMWFLASSVLCLQLLGKSGCVSGLEQGR